MPILLIFLLFCAIFSTGCTPMQLREAEAIEKAAILVEEEVAKAEADVCLKCWDGK